MIISQNYYCQYQLKAKWNQDKENNQMRQKT